MRPYYYKDVWSACMNPYNILYYVHVHVLYTIVIGLGFVHKWLDELPFKINLQNKNKTQTQKLKKAKNCIHYQRIQGARSLQISGLLNNLKEPLGVMLHITLYLLLTSTCHSFTLIMLS